MELEVVSYRVGVTVPAAHPAKHFPSNSPGEIKLSFFQVHLSFP